MEWELVAEREYCGIGKLSVSRVYQLYTIEYMHVCASHICYMYMYTCRQYITVYVSNVINRHVPSITSYV